MQDSKENFNSEFKYATSFKRSLATFIDMLIANFIRIIVLTILGQLFILDQLRNFQLAFKAKFDSEIIGRDPDRIRFLMESQFFKTILLSLFCVFVAGALYHILLNCSKWQATIGKKLMKLVLVKTDGQKLSFIKSTNHYFLSIVPWFFTIYIFSYHLKHAISLYAAITDNLFNLIFGLLTLAWLQIHLITKKKTTMPDIICKTFVLQKI